MRAPQLLEQQAESVRYLNELNTVRSNLSYRQPPLQKSDWVNAWAVQVGSKRFVNGGNGTE